MNIIKSGDSFRIFSDAVTTMNKLPKGAYDINFNPMMGYSLSLRDDLVVSEKIYGDVQRRITKIINSFKASDRNLGVILTGKKGSGKSLTARLLAQEADYPVIVVESPTPGLADFLMSIKQEVIILFDEFEKHFNDKSLSYEDEGGPSTSAGDQSDLLSLFDGLDGGKKLFVITCNRKHDLNEFFLNRPGRFHYLFEYNTPTYDEIEEYLEDNLKDKKNVDEILKYYNLVDFTFDTLRAVCFDVNSGYSVPETILDLNIELDSKDYKVVIKFSNGEEISDKVWMTPFEDDENRVNFCVSGVDCYCRFNSKDVVMKGNKMIIPASDLNFDCFRDEIKDGVKPTLPEISSFELEQDNSVDNYMAKAVSSMYATGMYM